jgi:UDP-N-acetylmuramate dehydrogenase
MKLQELFGERLHKNEPLKNRTTYRLGGPAAYFLEVKTAAEASSAIMAAKEDGLPIFVLGGGSNILVSDKGFGGLVLSCGDRALKIEGSAVRASAGASLGLLVNQTAAAGLGGLDWAAGIPGTLGGAVRGNAGAYGGEIKDRLVSVETVNLETGECRILAATECGFGYRESVFKHSPLFVWSAEFSLPTGDKDALQAKIRDLVAVRQGKYPTRFGNAGSVFKNFNFANLEQVPEKIRTALPSKYMEWKKIPAAWLIESLGLKGKKIGNAMVSEEHGNFIVNAGGATSDEVLQLISYVKMKVRDELGIQLHEEVEFVGF